MKPEKAPILIFIYRRPAHLLNTLKSLLACDGVDDSPIIVYGDGARNKEEQKDIDATREVAKQMLGDSTEFHFSKNNKGLSASVIHGVTETLKKYNKVIVLEDDLSLASNFLNYMNEALLRYESENSVCQVSGYQFGFPEISNKNSALFLPITVSWGWATWKRAWVNFDPEANGWERLLSDQVLRKRFNLDGVYDYSSMLVRQMIGLRDSWAIRWYWTVYKRKGIVLFPPYTLVNNTGFDGSGTHGKGLLRKYGFKENSLNNYNFELPDSIEIIDNNYTAVKQSLKKLNGCWYGAILDRLRWSVTILKNRLHK